jgi:hypothetical protein
VLRTPLDFRDDFVALLPQGGATEAGPILALPALDDVIDCGKGQRISAQVSVFHRVCLACIAVDI